MAFYDGGLWRPITPAKVQIQSALTPKIPQAAPRAPPTGFPRAPYAHPSTNIQKTIMRQDTGYGSSTSSALRATNSPPQSPGRVMGPANDPAYDKYVTAGAPIAPLIKAAAPLIKTGLGLVAGYVGSKLFDGNNGGQNDMNGNRYGGWSDWGVEGPGVFSPKDVTPTMYGTVTKQWVANGTLFQRNEDGTISVQKKDGTVKTYRPYKPIVFGKKTDAKKLARVAKKHRSIYKELHKMFGTKTRRAK